MNALEAGEKHLHPIRSILLPGLILLAVWGIVILVVNPVGEFMINDDWSFVRSLDALKGEGTIIETGWGHGGPALITHLLWGLVFVDLFGHSLFTLRVSVLAAGIMGSFGLLILLRLASGSWWIAVWGALTLALNPLFLSQCFTFMTDVTFTFITIFSLVFLYLAALRSHTGLAAFGLFLALSAILTRQLGVVIPLGFLAACLIHPKARKLGRLNAFLLVLFIVVIPWLVYEYYLSAVDSTPLTQHDVIASIIGRPLAKGAPDYLAFVGSQLLVAVGYVSLSVSPVLALRYGQYVRSTLFKRFFLIATMLFMVVEFALVVGLVDLPVYFHRNVVYDFGIGPILLKDVYILGVQRTAALPVPLYYFLVYWSLLAVGALLMRSAATLKRLLKNHPGRERTDGDLLASLTFPAVLAYLGIILLTGFHDRYLIPLSALVIVWLACEPYWDEDSTVSVGRFFPAFVTLAFLGCFAVAGTHDFMEMKRKLKKSHDYLIEELKVDPCNMDGGFEFNGYHCYRKGIKPAKGLSWWWVRREDYLVTLGPLPGYRTVRTFPFHRYLGRDGAIFVLKPL